MCTDLSSEVTYMNYAYTDKLFELTDRMDKVRRDVEARMHPWGARESTHTGDPVYDKKEPFLDAFEQLADAPYPIALAEGIVRSWLETKPVIYDTELIVGVNRPQRRFYEHFSWGLYDHLWAFENRPDYLEIHEEIERRYQAIGPARITPGSNDDMINACRKFFGSTEAANASEHGLWATGGYQGHTVPGYPKLLSLGLDGTLEQIDLYDANTIDPDKHAFYEALRIIVRGLSAFAELYADLAKEMGEKADSDEEKARLEMIETNCRAVAHKAPETLYEALQLEWFYCLWDWVDCIGRADLYLYPFYERENDDIFREELITSFMLKIREHGVHNVTIAGVDPETGKSSANDLTMLILQIARTMHCTHPRITIRVDKQTPAEVLALGVQMWSEGMSDPTVVSDTLVIDGLREFGVSLKDARDYSMLGCQEIEIPGKSNFGCEDGVFNLAKVLEYTLNDGCDATLGIRMVPKGGRISTYNSIDEIWADYSYNVEYLTRAFTELCSLGQTARDKNFSKLVKCVYTDDCIVKGVNMDGGGARYNYGCVETMGMAVTADAFAALEKVVFTDKTVDAATLDAAMKANFEGYEDVRAILLSAPKYGNDDEFADSWAIRVLEHFWTECTKYRSVRGGAYMGACSLLDGGVYYGNDTHALPDGHRRGDPLGNSIGPRPGADKNGVTAMLKSVAKLPLKLGLGGTTVNTLIPCSSNSSEEQKAAIAALFRAYLENGGLQAQITTASLEDMLDAQIHPELHENLIIRVGGYSALFNDCEKEMQDELISRHSK